MTRVAIIGAGFGGIAVAHQLRQAGYRDLTIFERAPEVGGVWRDNLYPGCACDIPAPLYSYSFAPNPEWTRRFPPRAEILDYLRACVRDFGLTAHLRLGTEVVEAAWTGSAWRVVTAAGAEEFDVLIPAMGQLSRPVIPVLPGAAEFGGIAMHTAQWDASVDLTGRRVAVLGTGASAIQLVPAIAGQAAHVTVLQRTPPWTLPKPDRRYGRLRRALHRRVPVVLRAARAGTWLLTVVTGKAVTGSRLAQVVVGTISRTQRAIQGRGLAGVRPDYALGCKRVLFTGDWYRTLRRPDVSLVTSDVDRLTPAGVRTADGVEHPVDVLVYGTGFAATEFLAPVRVHGRTGPLDAEWRDGAYAHLGIAVPGFPNLFLMYGPNTNTGNTSVVYFHESQARYIVQAVRHVDAHGPVEVRREVAEAFDAEIQRRLARSVWTACSSWYRTATGRVVTNWPGMAGEYRARTKVFRPADYAPAGQFQGTSAPNGLGSRSQ
ncbi:flavin-containing monooxygenase [Hamadaea tsunoensis]|uniref:flavin-containing monooxygenase n=1 Tax=Hamadaea tsunoensis TaxID=53368 RepID=UPI0004272634|nr:NAD(P)/FAD-dependent oxidoreductase [Hamadaea tsunoensis]